MVNENRKNRLKIVLIILLMSISIGALSYSFGLVTSNPRFVSSNDFSISEINFGLESKVESVSLGQVLPTLDKFGILNEPFTFTVTNVSDKNQDYVIKLVDGQNYSTISNKEIRYQLIINDEVIGIYTLANSGLIDSGNLDSNASCKYSIRIWLDYNSEEVTGVWDKIIFVDTGNGNLDTSGANEPKLTDGMIPVYYDNNREVWKKADETNIDKDYRWYDYDSLVWANVVTVSEEKRNTYLNAKVGTEIMMDDINSMWVWIPRYKYTIFNSEFNETNPKEIKITFENELESTGTVICNSQFNKNFLTSQVCKDEVNGQIINDVSTYTHPAFTFGDTELEGLWVAKFEAGTSNDSMCTESASVKNCDSNNLDIYIKPNINSLGYITMANLQNNFRRMELSQNIYGFNGDDSLNSDLLSDTNSNNLDIHMIKNSEWGAVSYLYHSKYGKYANNDYSSSKKELYYNDTLMTGYSVGSINSKGGTYQYNVNHFGTGASTTGNVYGVYDMVGGKGEMVMVSFQTDSNQFIINENSGFTSSVNEIYYDAYYNNDSLSVTNLGDGLKEVNWYSDTKNILTNNVLYRGGSSSSNDGMFGINSLNGQTSATVGSRPILITSSNINMTKW